MTFLDELNNLIKAYNEMVCFCPTNEYNEYAAALQKSYIRIEKDLKHLKEIYCTYDKNDYEYDVLKKKLKKARKGKKRWKNKYLELYNYVKTMEDTIYVTTKDSTMDRIKAGLGIPPIKLLNEDGLKPTKMKG